MDYLKAADLLARKKDCHIGGVELEEVFELLKTPRALKRMGFTPREFSLCVSNRPRHALQYFYRLMTQRQLNAAAKHCPGYALEHRRKLFSPQMVRKLTELGDAPLLLATACSIEFVGFAPMNADEGRYDEPY